MEETEIREILNGRFDLEFVNFLKHHRKLKDDSYRRTWTKIQNDWFRDPKIAQLTLAEQSTFLRLLCTYSYNSEHFRSTSVHILSRSIHVRPENVKRCLVKLLELQIVRFRVGEVEERRGEELRAQSEKIPVAAPPERVLVPPPKRPSNPVVVAVESLYTQHYPRHVGKTRGIEILRTLATNELPLLERAIKNYAIHTRGTETKYIKNFGNWAGEWRDWLENAPEKRTQKIRGL